MMAAAASEAGHHMERGIDGGAIDRIEIGLPTVGRAVVNEPKRAGTGAHSDRRHPAIGAGRDIAERPGRVEQAAMARIVVREADAAVLGILKQALVIIGPFNGPLLLLIRPALAALAAGNTCILTLSEALAATTEVLLELVPKYFDPTAVTAVAGGKEQNTKLLKLSFDFIFFTGSTFVGKIVARAAAENLTPVLLELGGMNPAVVDETANIPDAAKKI